jgi:hypothetical protein
MANVIPGVLIRKEICDFLNVGTTDTPIYELMGNGFNSLDESPNAQVETKAYINAANSSTITKGYQPSFAFNSDFIDSEAAISFIYDVSRGSKVGGAAETDYVRVEKFRSVDEVPDLPATAFPARKFRVAIQVSSISGGGAEVMVISGNLNAMGDAIDGYFDISDSTFTPFV